MQGDGQATRLVVKSSRAEVLIPLAEEICRVDIAAKRIVVTPPEGLLEVNGEWRMKIDVVTIFPEMVEAALAPGVVGRARQAGVLDIVVHNLRDFTTDRHRVVDDVPFGGGPGMVLKPEPLFEAVERLSASRVHPTPCC